MPNADRGMMTSQDLLGYEHNLLIWNVIPSSHESQMMWSHH